MYKRNHFLGLPWRISILLALAASADPPIVERLFPRAFAEEAVPAPETPFELPPAVEIAAPAVVRVEAAPEDAAPPNLRSVVEGNGGPDRSHGELSALAAGELDRMRGGFELPESGLRFSFGIERAVFVNGELVASTTLNLQHLPLGGGTAAAQAPAAISAAAALPGSAFSIIQNGNGNAFTALPGQTATGTVIQNTLNGQAIGTVTTIDAVVNSAQMLRLQLLGSAIRDGIVGSLRR